MGPVLHGSATTTEAIRCAIQHSQESLNVLARHGINPKTVAQWRKRTSAADLPTGPTVPNSTVLSVNEETIIVAFRRHTLLAPLSRLPPGQWHGPNLCHCLKSPRLCILYLDYPASIFQVVRSTGGVKAAGCWNIIRTPTLRDRAEIGEACPGRAPGA